MHYTSRPFPAGGASPTLDATMPSRREMDRTSVYETAGRNMRRLRLGAGLTQQALAERAGLSTPFVSFLEIGRKKGSLESYDRLAAALGAPLSALFDPGSGKAPWGKDPLPGLNAAERQSVWRLVQTLRRKK